jgi:hypothetical protein
MQLVMSAQSSAEESVLPEFMRNPQDIITATDSNRPTVGTLVQKPRDIDVAWTRRKSWKNHPGSKYYRSLIKEAIPVYMVRARPLKDLAESIVDKIVKEKGAVFLNAEERQGGWLVMNYDQAVIKASCAIRNAEQTARNASLVPPPRVVSKASQSLPSKRRRSETRPETLANPCNPSATGVPAYVQDLPPIIYKEGSPPESRKFRCIYKIKEGTVKLDAYTIEIINHMCKQKNANAAVIALDIPLKQGKEETDSERHLRLQLRQRFISAMSVGISPLDFSRKLVALWGAEISETKEYVIPKEESDKKRREEKAQREPPVEQENDGGRSRILNVPQGRPPVETNSDANTPELRVVLQ